MGSCDNHPEVSPQLIYRLLQDLGSAVMAVDSERRILFINKQARNLLGIGDRDLSQVPISELASSGEISTLRSIVGALDTALIDRRTFQRELLTVETTDRGIRTIACNVTPLFADSGDLEAATAIFSDITEVHAGERRRVGLECEAHIARVVSWVAHEIRNPLATIRMYAEIAARDADESLQSLQDSIQVITDQVDVAQGRISNVVRTVSGPTTDPWAPAICSFEQQLQEYLDNEMTTLDHLVIHKEISPGEYHVPLSEHDVHSLISHILTNAVEAISGPGEIHVNLSKHDGRMHFRVKDTGCGFPDEDPQRLVEPFITAKERGVGLGLSSVKRICDTARGYIHLENTPAGGGCVTADLPILSPDVLRGCRILLVEDEDNLRNLLARKIEQVGGVVLHASDGLEALQSMADTNPDAMVTDLRLPGIGGFDLLQKTSREMPVLVISGASHIEGSGVAPRKPGVAFLGKPFDLDEFILALTYVFWEVSI